MLNDLCYTINGHNRQGQVGGRDERQYWGSSRWDLDTLGWELCKTVLNPVSSN